MHKRAFSAVALVGVSALALAACGSGSTTGAASSAASAKTSAAAIYFSSFYFCFKYLAAIYFLFCRYAIGIFQFAVFVAVF